MRGPRPLTARKFADSPINKEILCASEEGHGSRCSTDPRDEGCSKGIQRLYEELCQACTHWAWDADDEHPLYPDFPYDAKTSYAIEQAYRNGGPSHRVCACAWYVPPGVVFWWAGRGLVGSRSGCVGGAYGGVGRALCVARVRRRGHCCDRVPVWGECL